MTGQPQAVAQIRSFNRFYTHILGLLDKHILDSAFSLTEARVLLEISKKNGCQAHEIATRLGLDRSYLSRILKRFDSLELIDKSAAAGDGRFIDLRITGAGREVLAQLSGRSDAQIASLIRGLPAEDVAEVLAAMALIRLKLSQAAFPVTIRPYRKGDEEFIIRRHRELYLQEYRLSGVFADYVDRGVRQLADRLTPDRECILIPEVDGRPMGSIAIASYGGQTAQLRYFLLEPEARGYGLGLRLVAAALDFAHQAGYKDIFLETISALTTARTIYARSGFRLVHTENHAKWGVPVEEERWEMEL